MFSQKNYPACKECYFLATLFVWIQYMIIFSVMSVPNLFLFSKLFTDIRIYGTHVFLLSSLSALVLTEQKKLKSIAYYSISFKWIVYTMLSQNQNKTRHIVVLSCLLRKLDYQSMSSILYLRRAKMTSHQEIFTRGRKI